MEYKCQNNDFSKKLPHEFGIKIEVDGRTIPKRKVTGWSLRKEKMLMRETKSCGGTQSANTRKRKRLRGRSICGTFVHHQHYEITLLL